MTYLLQLGHPFEPFQEADIQIYEQMGTVLIQTTTQSRKGQLSVVLALRASDSLPPTPLPESVPCALLCPPQRTASCRDLHDTHMAFSHIILLPSDSLLFSFWSTCPHKVESISLAHLSVPSSGSLASHEQTPLGQRSLMVQSEQEAGRQMAFLPPHGSFSVQCPHLDF